MSIRGTEPFRQRPTGSATQNSARRMPVIQRRDDETHAVAEILASLGGRKRTPTEATADVATQAIGAIEAVATQAIGALTAEPSAAKGKGKGKAPQAKRVRFTLPESEEAPQIQAEEPTSKGKQPARMRMSAPPVQAQPQIEQGAPEGMNVVTYAALGYKPSEQPQENRKFLPASPTLRMEQPPSQHPQQAMRSQDLQAQQAPNMSESSSATAMTIGHKPQQALTRTQAHELRAMIPNLGSNTAPQDTLSPEQARELSAMIPKLGQNTAPPKASKAKPKRKPKAKRIGNNYNYKHFVDPLSFKIYKDMRPHIYPKQSLIISASFLFIEPVEMSRNLQKN